MKIFYSFILFLFLIAGKIFSQNNSTQVFNIDSLPVQGILLDKGWKFHPGDNPEYAQPGYDDSKWQDINPTLDVHDLPQIKQGIVWFRLHLLLDSNLLKEQLALIMEQSGASEIYVNGILIHRFGIFDTDPAKVKAYDPKGLPIGFPLNKDGYQTLAIRYVLQPGLKYTNIFATQNYAANISINNVVAASQKYGQKNASENGQNLFILGIFLMLAVLHLSLFLFYRSQKANLYFSLFALFTIVGTAIGFGRVNGGHWVEDEFYFFNLSVDLIFFGRLLMVIAIYYLLEQKRGLWYSIFLILCVLGIIAFALPGYWGWEIGNVLFSNLINLEITRIAFIAVKKKKKGAWIIALGSLCFLVSWAAFMILGHPGGYDTFTNIVFVLSFICIPVSASVYLGVDFAFTNRLLQRKLIEVNELSKKTIAQEQEKQQMLSDQNETLEKQVTERTVELNQSLEELKSTQAQLIQSEKMASLGELTAGIAHEIQNPLNFVNNFSEVNTELIEELKSEIPIAIGIKAKTEVLDELLNNIAENEQKINHHGKRADAIVKGMLLHSQTSAGHKEPTNINTLADEYLRLSYNGLRAKDKSFNVTLQTDFDETIGNVSIIPQDIGRVLLNLYNNAFYAVAEKRKHTSTGSVQNGYEPTVSVSTRKENGKVEVCVKDNGNGIPQKIVDKIFQPFFTTKPTGQGTGLGLSLAYDIVKVHGGEIRVESNEGAGSEFIIQLPLKK